MWGDGRSQLRIGTGKKNGRKTVGSQNLGILLEGNSATFSARLAMLPAEGYGIVLLTNVNSGPFFPGTAAVMDGLIRILRGHPMDTVWPLEILLKLGILALLIVSVIRMIVIYRRWSRRGFPRRLTASRRVVMPLVREALGTALVLLALPRWIGVPLRTILEYFPDLGIAIIVGVVTGALGALMRAFVLAQATPHAAHAAG